MHQESKRNGASKAKSMTAIILIDIGVFEVVATWLRGCQGDLTRYALELMLAPLLGLASAFLFEAVDRRFRRWAMWPVWAAMGIGAVIALRHVAPSEPLSGVAKVCMGGVLFGALLSTAFAAFVSACATQILRALPNR